MPKKVLLNDQSNNVTEKITTGINILANAVKITLGPSGKIVIFEREHGDPVVTKDGVTVARQIELEDPMENMAAAMVKQAVLKTATLAGDGTTTATIYAQAIYDSGVKFIKNGMNPQEVKRGIDTAIEIIVKNIEEISKPVIDLNQIKQVAICSSNQDKLTGETIAYALEQVGRDGVVTIEEGQSLDTSVFVIDGMQFPRGYVSPQFATDIETQNCEYEDPYILLTDQKLNDLKTTIKVLSLASQKLKNKPLVIVADDYSDDCLNAIILNKLKANIKVVAVKAPEFGDRRRDVLEDIAISTGGTVLTKDNVKLENVDISHLGTCKKIKIDRDTTTIIEGNGKDEEIQARITLIKNQIDKMTGDFDKERLQERLARLTGGIAQISVGGMTEAEVREKKDRIDDALHACKAAIEEGILPGGGVAAVHLSHKIAEYRSTIDDTQDDMRTGLLIVENALKAPLKQIAINTGQDAGVIVNEVINNNNINYGFDAMSKKYGDMIELGIIVPSKVERVALQNAASIAGLLLTTDCMISIIKDNAVQEQSQFPSLM